MGISFTGDIYILNQIYSGDSNSFYLTNVVHKLWIE